MYIRFQSIARDGASRIGRGIFCAAFDIWYAAPSPRLDWRLTELRGELDWFNDQLDEPRRLYYRPGRRAERSGVCWFRGSAHEHIGRALHIAWLLRDFGVPIDRVRSTHPGAILWQDEVQVVALPSLN